jgi:cell division protein FtsX
MRAEEEEGNAAGLCGRKVVVMVVAVLLLLLLLLLLGSRNLQAAAGQLSNSSVRHEHAVHLAVGYRRGACENKKNKTETRNVSPAASRL